MPVMDEGIIDHSIFPCIYPRILSGGVLGALAIEDRVESGCVNGVDRDVRLVGSAEGSSTPRFDSCAFGSWRSHSLYEWKVCLIHGIFLKE